MQMSYSIIQAIRAALEYELLNELQFKRDKDDQIVTYFQKRIKELDEYAASQQR